jgi:hypothetical protein
MAKRLVLKRDVRAEYAKQRAQGHSAKTALDIARHYCKMRQSPFYRAWDGDAASFQGREFRVRIDHDSSSDTPWENCSPLGAVEERRYGDTGIGRGQVWIQKPDSRHYGYAYDYAAAYKEVQTWNKGRDAALIVDREIERFRAWLNDQWHYVSIGVELDGETEWLGGVEDDCPEYLAETMEELARELLARADDEQRRADVQRCFI